MFRDDFVVGFVLILDIVSSINDPSMMMVGNIAVVDIVGNFVVVDV
jgi:hypothetical protein